MTPPVRGSETPTAMAPGRAGLDTGPRELNTVGTPSSPRATDACRKAGGYSGANRNAIPAGSDQVDEVAGHADRGGPAQHDLRKPSHLAGSLALHPQGHGEPGHL